MGTYQKHSKNVMKLEKFVRLFIGKAKLCENFFCVRSGFFSHDISQWFLARRISQKAAAANRGKIIGRKINHPGRTRKEKKRNC